ncbi:hypothetical protein D3C72_1421550 [compost metagenome]
MVFHGNTTAVIGDCQETFGIEMDFDEVGVAGDGLVHGVVDDFGKEVVQRLFIGAANIHAGAHAHRFQPFEHADRRSTVVVTRRRHGGRRRDGRNGCGFRLHIQVGGHVGGRGRRRLRGVLVRFRIAVSCCRKTGEEIVAVVHHVQSSKACVRISPCESLCQ